MGYSGAQLGAPLCLHRRATECCRCVACVAIPGPAAEVFAPRLLLGAGGLAQQQQHPGQRQSAQSHPFHAAHAEGDGPFAAVRRGVDPAAAAPLSGSGPAAAQQGGEGGADTAPEQQAAGVSGAAGWLQGGGGSVGTEAGAVPDSGLELLALPSVRYRKTINVMDDER